MRHRKEWNKLINNETNRKVKNYSINRSDLTTYYNVGKILNEAGKHYGEGIIREYSKRITTELGNGYSKRNLWLMLSAQLSWSHYCELLTLKSIDEIDYYIMISEKQNLSVSNYERK